MDKLNIKYCTYAKALPPQPIRIKTPGWGGSAEKMQDGSDGQPWHCLPFVEATTYGLELVYQYETPCHVVNDNGRLRFEWDFAREPGGMLTGGEFVTFSPKQASRYYLFNTMLDLQPPPGYVVRTEPHPRFFTDETDTVPLALAGHLQNEWYPRLLFVVFRAPRPGQRHIFQKGEPFVQILFVPQRITYETTPMTSAEAAQRRELQGAMQAARLEIAEHAWTNSDGFQRDNHYKVLARTFAQGGLTGLEEAVHQAVDRHEQSLPNTIAECLALGAQLVRERKYREAGLVFSHVLVKEPRNAEALSNLGICAVGQGNVAGLDLMAQAVAIEPRLPRYHSSLGEMQRLLGRFQQAEAAFRASLQLNPNDPGIWSVLGLTLAQQGRVAEGLEASQTALAMGKTVPAVHFRMGLILVGERRTSEARACFETALALDPGFADARRALQDMAAGVPLPRRRDEG